MRIDTTRPSFLTRLSRPIPPQWSEHAAPSIVQPDYSVGLDVGGAGEPTALAVLERTPLAEDKGRLFHRFAVRHLRRFPGGASYGEVASEVAGLFAQPPLKGGLLLVDVTAAGEPVLDLLRGAGIAASVVGVAITAGRHSGPDGRGGWLVPRVEVAGTLQVLLQQRRLRVAPDLPEAALLARELSNFRVRGVIQGDDVALWREGEHDDLVLAVGIAAWEGERGVQGGGAYWVC